MKTLNLFKIIITSLFTLFIVAACGSPQSTDINNSESSVEDILGKGEMTVDASELVTKSSDVDLTDEELIANHISFLESVIDKVTANASEDDPEGLKEARAQLIADIDARIEKINSDEEFRAIVIKRLCGTINRARSGTPKATKEQFCAQLKKVLDDQASGSIDIPAKLIESVQTKFDKFCSAESSE